MALRRIEIPGRRPPEVDVAAVTKMSERSQPPSMERAFVRGYDTIRAVCAAPNAPGVGIFAIDREGVAAAAIMAAQRDGVQAAIVGRHPETDVPLPDDSLSMRHLAVVLHPLGEDRPWFRLVDLRTGTGMRDERGQRVEHFVSDGPVFVHLGEHCLFVVPLCDRRLSWPADPHDAWRSLPERLFRTIDADHRADVVSLLGDRTAALPVADPDATLVQDIPGPRFARPVRNLQLPERPSGPPPLGELLIASSDGACASVLVDAATARSGLLLGRDERCDNASLPLLADRRISRVHLLILEVEGTMYAIDTASTNGVWQSGAHAGGTVLRFGQRLTIARSLAWVKWMPPPGTELPVLAPTA